LLVGIGGYFGWSHASAGNNSGMYFAMQEVSQPFAQSAVMVASHANPSAISKSANLLQFLPIFIAAVWLCGAECLPQYGKLCRCTKDAK
jgi:hypothetical protein